MTLILNAIATLVVTLTPTVNDIPVTPVVTDAIGPGHRATCLADWSGDLWAGTLGGGLVPVTGEANSALTSQHGLPGQRVNDCVALGGRLFVATDQGLAGSDDPETGFELLESGRFLRVAVAGDDLVAARDDGWLALFPTEEAPPRRLTTDKTAIALAGHSDGRFAAGSMDGTVTYGLPGRQLRTLRLELPVTDLAFTTEGLLVLVPGELYLVNNEGVATRVDDGPAPTALTRSGERLHAPGLAALEVAAAARTGTTWYAATDDGIWQKEKDSLSWQKRPSVGCPCGPRVAALASFAGDLWVGGFDTGLCRFDGQTWTQYRGPAYLPSDMVNHMAVGRHRLYVATLKGVVVIDDQLRFSQHTRSECVDNTRGNCPWYESVTGIAADKSTRNVWIADTGSVHRWSSRKWQHLYRKAGVASEKITRIAAHNGHIAVGTSDQGVLFSGPNLAFGRMDDQQGLADNWVMDLVFDRSGALWVATCTRGISRYHEGQWRTWQAADGLGDDYTLSVADIDGRIWIGHFRGVSILTERGMVQLTPGDGLPGQEVHDIVQHQGRVYLATDGGLGVVEFPS